MYGGSEKAKIFVVLTLIYIRIPCENSMKRMSVPVFLMLILVLLFMLALIPSKNQP